MGARSSDFEFWEDKSPVHGHSCSELHEGGGCSPPAFGPESSSLLPENHQYSCLSPESRIRAIMDGQRELMEMIKGMPESSYELSLKDMVDKKEEEEVMEDVVKHNREKRAPRKANTKICRSESMESEVFLLKMFVPVSISSKKKKTKKKKKKTRRQTSEGDGRQPNKDWWKIIFLAIISNRTSEKKNESKRRRGCLLF